MGSYVIMRGKKPISLRRFFSCDIGDKYIYIYFARIMKKKCSKSVPIKFNFLKKILLNICASIKCLIHYLYSNAAKAAFWNYLLAQEKQVTKKIKRSGQNQKYYSSHNRFQ